MKYQPQVGQGTQVLSYRTDEELIVSISLIYFLLILQLELTTVSYVFM